MATYTIVGIGEVLWDVFDDSEELGGAPINFAYHANALGAKGFAVSTVGNDQRGKKALAALTQKGVSIECIATLNGAMTGYVKADVDKEGVASYQFPDNTAWDNLVLNDAAMRCAKDLDAVCFGSLAQRSEVSRKSIMTFLDAVPATALKVFDLNLRQNFYGKASIEESLYKADVLKLNDDELNILDMMLCLSPSSEEGDKQRLRQILSFYNLQLVVLTRGGQGSLLVGTDTSSEHPGFPITDSADSNEIKDTIGAGDSFTAATVLGLLKGASLAQINEHANRVAAYVCSCKGAMPPLPEEIRL